MGAPVSMRNTMSSGALTTSVNIKASQKDRSGVLCGVLVIHDGTTDPVVTLYDSLTTATTAGTELFYCKLDAGVHKGALETGNGGYGGGSGKYQELYILPDVIFKLGCYVVIANATVYVYYR